MRKVIVMLELMLYRMVSKKFGCGLINAGSDSSI